MRKNSFLWIVPILLLSLGLLGYIRHSRPAPKYVIMIDAGSTGTRLYIYTISSPRFQNVHSLLNHDSKTGVISKKIEPGLYQYRDDPEEAAKSLQPLLDFALRQIPGTHYRSSPVYLRATGGLRSLPPQKIETVLTSIRKFLSRYPFTLADSHVSVISGVEEAVYGWTSLNFLLEAEQSIGALDMGGSSTQISLVQGSTMAPSICKHKVQFVDKSYKVCALSLHGFGLESSFASYRQSLLDDAKSQGASTVKSPCLAKGHTETVSEANFTGRIVGDGDFDSCLGQLLPTLSKKKQDADPAVALLPALAVDNEFVAFNGFVQTHRALGLKRRPTLREWQEASRTYCSRGFKDIEADSQPSNRCFKAAWLLLLMHQVYGLGFDERRIDFVKDVSVGPNWGIEPTLSETMNVEVSWTIGAVLMEMAALRVA
eukprot:TRINITY_DN6041_c0_g1_i1.p1 TRINITY_DN6041_c0_g1~~TRINITY_DN6041_c0_g1_i1.p1  ORF type:complete len:428 (-),score=40.46 TRINITY_DN6041_c0_g1_i1:88-1371(-)